MQNIKTKAQYSAKMCFCENKASLHWWHRICHRVYINNYLSCMNERAISSVWFINEMRVYVGYMIRL